MENVVVVKGKGEDENLFSQILALKENLDVKKIEFEKLEEFCQTSNPQLVLFDLDHQEKEIEGLLSRFSRRHPETYWAASSAEPPADVLIRLMRAGMDDFLRQPVQPKEFHGLLERAALKGKKNDESAQETHQIISFFSSKGGVGVSFAALNFAVSLAKKKNSGKVLLADFVLQHGNLAEFLDLTPEYTLLDLVENLERMDANLLENSVPKHASGVFLLPCPRRPEESECFNAKETAEILKILKGIYTHVILDVGHELTPTALACLDGSDEIFQVITPDLPSLCNAKASLQMFQKLNYPPEKVKLVLNRWHMKGELEASVIEKHLNHTLFHKLAEDTPLALESLNRGFPLVESSKRSPLIKGFEELANRVCHVPA